MPLRGAGTGGKSRRPLFWALGMLAVSVGVNLVDVPGAFPLRVDEQLQELANQDARWVEVMFRAGLVVELWAELAVATALMIAVHEAGHAVASRLNRRAPVVLLAGSAANLLCAALALLALTLGGSGAVAGHFASLVPDPLFALLVAGVWVGANNLLPVADDGRPRDGLRLLQLPPPVEPPAPVDLGAMHPAMVRTVLGKALDDGDTSRALPLAEILLEVISRQPGTTAEAMGHQLALSAPLLLRCAAAPEFPPALAGRIAVRLGFVELRSVLHRGPEPLPGLPRAEGAEPATDDERLDGVARLMQLGARLAPGDLDARLGLAWTRSAQHRDDEAQKLARAVRLKLDAEPRVPGDHRADLADVLRAVSAARLGAGEQADRLLARVARNHRGGRLPEELAAAMDYAQRVDDVEPMPTAI